MFDVTSAAGEPFLLHHLEQAMEADEIEGAVVAKNGEERRRFWSIREESFLCDRRYPHGFWYDVSVPLGALDSYAKALFERIDHIGADVKVFLFGHLGDGNLHLTVSAGREMAESEAAVDEAVFAGIAAMGGSFSAEHGIGNQKRETLARYGSPAKLDLMRGIKQLLDPNGIMNPGKVL